MLNWIVWNGTVFDIWTVLTLNWIVWNRTVLTFKVHTYAKLNSLKCTVFDIWTVLILNWIVWNRTVLTLKNIKLFICIKMNFCSKKYAKYSFKESVFELLLYNAFVYFYFLLSKKATLYVSKK